jgi:hypothetical protein
MVLGSSPDRVPQHLARESVPLSLVFRAWAITVVGLAWASLGLHMTTLIGLVMTLFVSPVLWVRTVGDLDRARGVASYAAKLLLFAVPIVLVGSSYTMTQSLSQALTQRHLETTALRDGRAAYIPLYRDGYRHQIAGLREGLRISVGGGLLAALLEILGLYCWTRRRLARTWIVGLLLALFGPALACAIYLFAPGLL